MDWDWETKYIFLLIIIGILSQQCQETKDSRSKVWLGYCSRHHGHAIPAPMLCRVPHSGDLVLSENREEIERMSGWTAQESRKGASCKNVSPVSWETLAATGIE